jgi:hypothetical protein
MSLVRVTLPDVLPAPSDWASALIADARLRIEEFTNSHAGEPIHAFVPSDFSLVWGALAHVQQAGLAGGTLFCEWGSGAGVVTCLASMLGFDACGIEVEGDLVALSENLALKHRVNAAFCRGNFIPQQAQRMTDNVGDFEWLAVGGSDPYQMELDIDDFDVIFAYPWPGEARILEQIFHRYAADGALLMTYNGLEGIRLLRKRHPRQAD